MGLRVPVWARQSSSHTASTQRSRRQFSQRMTGLLWNLTFAITTENVCAGESGHSQVAITALGKVPAERLHPKAAYSRCRLTGARGDLLA